MQNFLKKVNNYKSKNSCVLPTLKNVGLFGILGCSEIFDF